jgi:hypothetical protein
MASAAPATAVRTGAAPPIGYHILTSNGGVHNYGSPWYGSDACKLPAGVPAPELPVGSS